MVPELQDGPRLGNVAIKREDKNCLQDAERELHHLEKGEIFFQRILQSKGCPQIVEVHEGMHKGINPGTKEGSPISDTSVQQQPPDHADRQVVIHVEKG